MKISRLRIQPAERFAQVFQLRDQHVDYFAVRPEGFFEIEARRHSGQETLFVVDDIADSFDYKNKYAIIHLNSFMYEPILDMSDDHLRALYADAVKL